MVDVFTLGRGGSGYPTHIQHVCTVQCAPSIVGDGAGKGNPEGGSSNCIFILNKMTCAWNLVKVQIVLFTLIDRIISS